MGNNHGCGEFVRSGADVYILDTKNRALGATVMPCSIYLERSEKMITTGDARHLFDNSTQYESFTDEELDAMVAYASAGNLALTAEHVPATAFEDRRDLAAPGVALVQA